MTKDNVVPMPHALQAAPVIIDDSRLQTLWDRQHRRQNWIVGGCAATALLIAGALVVMAFRINAEPPKVEVAAPVVNIPPQPAPVVNVTVPEQPAPVVNVTVPNAAPVLPAPAQPLRTGESKVVTKYTQFTAVSVGQYEVHSGWTFQSSKDTVPSTQYCYVLIGTTGRLSLARDSKPLPSVDADAQKLGVTPAQAAMLMKSCRWFGTTGTLELRDPTRQG